jgi:hypothetical protein
MKTNKVVRTEHIGKNFQEKEAYRLFLASKFEIDKTETEPVNINKTNESSYDEDEPQKISRNQKKSFKLAIKDFLHNNWVSSIIIGLLILFVGIFINAVTTIKVNEEKISNVQKDVEDIKKVTNDKQHGLSALEKNFEVFKTEVSKDLEYIKKKIKL